MTFRLCLTTIVLSLALISMPGCGNAQQRQQQLDQYQQALKQTQQKLNQTKQEMDKLRTATQQGRTLIEQLPDDSEKAQKLQQWVAQGEKALKQAESARSKLEKRTGRLSDRIEKLKSQADNPAVGVIAAGQTLQEMSGLLPPPFNSIAGIGGLVLSGVGGLFGARERKKRKGEERVTEQISRSIESAKIAGDGNIDFNNEKVRKLLSKAQDNFTKKRVKEVTS